MKQYMIVVVIQDGEFEYGDQMMFGWDGDPTDEFGILTEYTGDNTLVKCSYHGKYESESDYRVYSLYAIKEIDENDIPILKKYF
tara:strand:+ start:591 stop:842 length:252 start_codon:yes stop_codon:yes gene_type:complete